MDTASLGSKTNDGTPLLLGMSTVKGSSMDYVVSS
jgi:hypothetical protein